jgi:acetoin utilization deacetylase AcuC-like enzyme
MVTGFVFDPRFLEHDTGRGELFHGPTGLLDPEPHAERPERVGRVKELLERSGLDAKLRPVRPRPATIEEVAAYHTLEYIETVRKTCEGGGGEAGPFTPVGASSYEIALLAAGGAVASVQAVMDGEVTNAYGLLRPPGHHAVANLGMGFCIFNNVVIAARYAQRAYGLKRVLVLDWDVHHGNGTQDAFYADPSVLFFSLHQEDYYPPGSGHADEVGEGEAKGYTVNIPLPAGCGTEAYLHAFRRIVVPIAEQFKPELVLVSAGQDPNGYDPLARMLVHSDGFREMARTMKEIAQRSCEGRLVVLHEGGYSTAYVPFCTLAVIEELAGLRSGVEDPLREFLAASPGQALWPWQEAAIGRVAAIQSAFWKL